MRRLGMSLGVIALASATTIILAQGFKKISEFLTGFEEVPSVSTVASGTFDARISNDDSQIDWELSYSDLEGAVQQAHIHFGQKGVNGGISIWLCGNPNPPAIVPPLGTQTCPPPPATISGTATAANVVGPAGQGIAAGEFAELIRAMRAGKTYANVHSSKFPGGEIRSQIGPAGHADH
jgi:CHRD domain